MNQYLPLPGKYWLFCLLLTIGAKSYSQAVAYGAKVVQLNNFPQDNAQINLHEVISRLANDYNVKINYDTEQLTGKQVDLQLINSLEGNLEGKLERILKPFNLKFERYGKNSFAIFSDRSRSDIKKIDNTMSCCSFVARWEAIHVIDS